MKIVIALSVLLTTTTLRAESLDEKQYWKRQRDYINETLKRAERACGVAFTFDWVDQPALRSETEKTNHKPHSVCGNIVDSVASICREGSDEKAAVKAKITGFTCGHAKPRTLELTGGIVKLRGNNVEPNFSSWAKPWLLKHL